MRVLSLKKILKIIFVALIAALVFLTGAVIARAEDEVAPVTVGDFAVIGEEGAYSFDSDTGVLTITGDVTVSMAEEVGETGQSIIVAADCSVTLNGVNTKASKGPGILVKAPYVVSLNLAESSKNCISGASNYAGIEVGYCYDADNNQMSLAELTIGGSGALTVYGGNQSAAIGGSYNNYYRISSYHGNINITGGTITAYGGGSGAGIGSGYNNAINYDGSPTGSRSYKMQYLGMGDIMQSQLGKITVSGGTVYSYGGGEAAGIGGGNHTDTGMITLCGNAEVYAYGGTDGAGIGNGCGSSKDKGGEKGPGEYIAYITISDNAIVTAEGGRNGAGIGGGMYCDGVVTILSGTVTATGGRGDNGSYHHGGAGIGGGYVGHGTIDIQGGNVTAKAGIQSGAAGIGSGGTANKNTPRGSYTGRTGNGVLLQQTSVTITENNPSVKIQAYGGEYGGAGIGGGTGTDIVSVSICAGDIYAVGGSSSEEKKLGGAGIGSGLRGSKARTGKSDYYFTDTDIEVQITGGNVVAIGGWGASGIGSGAANKMAESITINVDETEGSSVEAYADGTKFAIDTRILNEDGSTTSRTDGRNYTGDYLQGTFVHAYEYQDGEETRTQNPEGLESIIVTNDVTGWNKNLQQMPDGYRSFATSVVGTGDYTVYTDEESIGKGEGRYFSICLKDQFDEDEIITKDGGTSEGGNNECIGVKYQVVQDALKDNFYLFPVKSVVVSKVVDADDTVKDGLNTTVYFALHNDTQGFATKKDGSVWTESIEIKNGKPQGKAYFVDVEDRAYDVWEVKGPSDTDNPKGEKFGAATLKSITTQHGGDMVLDTEEIQHGFKITKKEVTVDDKAMLQISAERIDALVTEDQSFTLSLYGDGKLIGSQKVNKESGLTLSWTVDRFVKDKDGNDTDQEINYVIKDTSNNAAIGEDQWSDEIVVTNTYEGLLTIKLSKLIEKYYQFEDGAKVNNTTVFKISIPSADDPDVNVFENYYAFTFTAAGEQNQEVEIALPKGAEKVVVEEVYGAGYRPVQEDEAGEAVADPFKMEIDLTADDFDLSTEQEITYTNEFAGGQIYSSGIINIYKDKAYVDPNQDVK